MEKNSTKYYHRILGHASLERVKGLLNDLGSKPTEAEDFSCPDCPQSKARHASHSACGATEEKPEVISVDLSGVINKQSLQGHHYHLLGKDRASEFVFVYFCREKSEVPSLTAGLIGDHERLSGHQMVEIHSDNGSEFKNRTLALLLLKEKILHLKSASNCPRQNGHIERGMQTVNSAARVLLNSFSLPKELLKEAVCNGVFLKNRLPIKRSKLSPFERFTGKKPTIDHLVELGEQVHSIVNDKYLTKRDCRTEKGFVVGFTQRRYTYRVFIPDKNRVTETSDVVFANHRTFEKPSGEKHGVGKDLIRVLVQTNGEAGTYSGTDGRTSPESLGAEGPVGTSTPNNLDKRKPLCTRDRLDNFFDQLREEIKNEVMQEAFSRREPHSAELQPLYENVEPAIEASTQQEVPPPLPPRHDLSLEEAPPWSLLLTRQHEEIGSLGVNTNQIPHNFDEAMEGNNKELWKKPIQEELKALVENKTWTQVEASLAKNPLYTKWVFCLKKECNGEVVRYKARLFVRGFEKSYGSDLFQTFAPVARLECIRSMLVVAAALTLHVIQFDISTASLNGTIQEDVCILPPQGDQLGKRKCL